MLNPHRLANIALAILIATALATSFMLDGPSMAQTEADIAADVAAAQAAASCGGDVAHCIPAHKRLQAVEVAGK